MIFFVFFAPPVIQAKKAMQTQWRAEFFAFLTLGCKCKLVFQINKQIFDETGKLT